MFLFRRPVTFLEDKHSFVTHLIDYKYLSTLIQPHDFASWPNLSKIFQSFYVVGQVKIVLSILCEMQTIISQVDSLEVDTTHCSADEAFEDFNDKVLNTRKEGFFLFRTNFDCFFLLSFKKCSV